MLAAASAKPPTSEEIKKLTVSDIAIMGGLADSLRDNLKTYIEIAPYTTSDPFGEKADYDYFVLLDSKEPSRMVSMFVAKKRSSFSDTMEQYLERTSA